MPRRLCEIRNKITSGDVAVLKHSLAFVQGRMREEQDRGKAAETRATAILAILGILAGLIVPFATTIASVVETNRSFLYFIIATSILFLLKGIYYAFRILGISKQYRLMPEYVYDFQSGTLEDVLRTDIAATMWSYERAKEPNTQKLFWLNRAQRNGVIAIFLYALFGLSLFVSREGLLALPPWTTCVSATFAVLALLISDKLAERFGIWRKS